MTRPLILDMSLCARIQIRRRSGASYSALCREFALSKGSVGKALKERVPRDVLERAARELPENDTDAGVDPAAGFVGIEKAAAELEHAPPAGGIADMLGRAEWGSKL